MLHDHDTSMLQHHIRSARDPILQHELQLLRKMNGLEDDEIEKVTDAIFNNCAFVADLNDLPDNGVKIVPKRESREELISRQVEGIKQ